MNRGGIIINDPSLIRQKKVMSLSPEFFWNTALAFLIVVISALFLNILQNFLISATSNSVPQSSIQEMQYRKIEIKEEWIQLTKNLFPRVINKLFAIKTAYAAEIKPYQAVKIKTSYSNVINIEPMKAFTVEVEFKNTGTATWYNYGQHFVSLYADNLSKTFWHKYWYTKEQPAKLQEKKVLPGEIGHLRFALQAPEVVGFYKLKFKLAAEDLAWITGGVLEIPVNVAVNNYGAANVSFSESSSAALDYDYRATKMIQSHNSTVILNTGEKVIFRVGFKNSGKMKWQSEGQEKVMLCLYPEDRKSIFYDQSWLNENCPTAVSSETMPGWIGYFNFTLNGSEAGNYEEKFVLKVGDKIISGGDLLILIQVNQGSGIENENNLGIEPTIRIGLYSTAEEVIIKADGNFEVRDSLNNLIVEVPADDFVKASFDFNSKQYALNYHDLLKTGLTYLRFIPKDANTVFEIVNYENRPSWDATINDNKFRGALELRYSEERDKLYVINELPMETYLKGLAESTNNAPYEFQKALVIAARTYALYNLNIGGKHPAAYFTLNATAYDQLYRGYNSELRLPSIVRAVEETRGQVVTYNGEVVVTPYFSRSDGRTRAWEEVWSGGSKPWLISKPDPYCSGLTLLGHGVGLSAYGAMKMALSGSTAEQILKYYYAGIEIKKVY
jgi:hypothetical protein